MLYWSLITLHLLTASIWIGGMFFAYFALRPVAATLLDPPIRLPLWNQTLKLFFNWVWLCIATLFISGYLMFFLRYSDADIVPSSLYLMQIVGWTMVTLFSYVYWQPFKKMSQYIIFRKLPEAGQCLNIIRKLVAINLSLGILIILIASSIRN